MLGNFDNRKFEMAEDLILGTKIKVLGVGGAGGNAVARMLEVGLAGVEFYVLNTDKQALQASPVANKLAIGSKVTSGLGAGANPEIGRQAALEDTERIIEILEGADMVFVTAGLGGGTGTGAAPVVASLAKELNALTVAVVTKPFLFEGPRRMKLAERGLAELAGTVDTVITIPNRRLMEIAPRGTTFQQALQMADDVLRQAVQGISDIITTPGLINRDFSDIKTIMLGMGYAMMGTSLASGESAAAEAARKAISSPLLEDVGVLGARGILINITSSSQIMLHDVDDACTLIREATSNEEVQINFGVVTDETMGDEVKVTVIATGFQKEEMPSFDFDAPRARAAALAAPVPDDPPIREIPEPVAAMPEPEPEPEPEPQAMEFSEPEPPVEFTPPQPGPPPLPEPPPNDLDTPAFMRRERRLFH
ncbi:MAG: cell division protein FtsZ [Acidimicrobiia bacterium]|nr:cell division protein FtsZ [Acidimicrobiia bacterium]